MEYWTLAQIKAKIKDDLDLEEETFIEDAELVSIINNAIWKAESLIHSLYEDYFLNSATMTLTAGASSYTAPADIYANKIRAIVYDDGTDKYEVKRITGADLFARLAEVEDSEDYGYILVNTDTAQQSSSPANYIDTSWDGIVTTKTITVSSIVTDSTKAVWQLCDNANNYERVIATITTPTASTVQITVDPALPAGTYRLLGVF